MEGGQITLAALSVTFLVGLSRAMILFIVTSGLSFVLGILRVPNLAHGSLYMIGAFAAHSIATLFGGGSTGFWLALFLAPLVVALVSLVAERLLFCHLYEREHLMLLLFTFALMLILGDLTKMVFIILRGPVVALLGRGRRRTVYPEKRPLRVWLSAVAGLALIAVTWLICLESGVKYSLVVTLVVTLSLVRISQLLFNYRQFREFAAGVAAEKPGYLILLNIAVVVGGVGLVLLGILVY